MNSKDLALDCMRFADNRKGEQIIALEVKKVTSIADYFVICSGTSEPHLRAILNEIEEQVFLKYHQHPLAEDGISGSGWVVLAYGGVLVHIMREDTRQRYDLETFWGDAPRLELK